MGSINIVERMNAGRNTKCLPAVPIKANTQLDIGKNINNAAIHHSHPIHSPIPATIPLLLCCETFLSKAL